METKKYHCYGCRKLWPFKSKIFRRTMIATCPCCRKYRKHHIYCKRPITGALGAVA